MYSVVGFITGLALGIIVTALAMNDAYVVYTPGETVVHTPPQEVQEGRYFKTKK